MLSLFASFVDDLCDARCDTSGAINLAISQVLLFAQFRKHQQADQTTSDLPAKAIQKSRPDYLPRISGHVLFLYHFDALVF